jgi:hypothetical protein
MEHSCVSVRRYLFEGKLFSAGGVEKSETYVISSQLRQYNLRFSE